LGGKRFSFNAQTGEKGELGNITRKFGSGLSSIRRGDLKKGVQMVLNRQRRNMRCRANVIRKRWGAQGKGGEKSPDLCITQCALEKGGVAANDHVAPNMKKTKEEGLWGQT